MTGARTDRERVLQLEARVAELEDELAAWRANDADEGDDEAAALRLNAVTGVLRAVIANARGVRNGVRGSARLLIHLLDRPGRLCRHAELLAAVSTKEDALPTGVNVRMCSLRHALRRMGFPSAITTVWGEGYVLDAAAAPAIARWVEPRHG